jgi:hypothetical protein
MQADIVRTHIEQLRHLPLGKPNGLVFGSQLDLAFAVFGGVEDQIAHGVVAGAGVTAGLWELN